MKNQEQLTEIAWKLLEEAITEGTITLTGQQGAEARRLETDSIIDLVKWLTAQKVKRPDMVDPPEDFIPPNTKESGESGDYEEIDLIKDD